MDPLTQRKAEELKPPTGFTRKSGKPVNQTFLWSTDPKGFGLRCTRAGVKTWVAQGRVGTIDRRITIGPFTLIKCEEARTRAKKVLLKMKDGEDPVRKAEQAEAQAATLREVSEHYVQHRQTRHGPLREATIADIRKHVAKSLAPWSDRPIASITPAMVLERFKVLSKTGPTQANQAMTIASSLHDWARKTNPDLPANPVSVLKGMWNPSIPKTEFVPFDKLPAVYAMLDQRRLLPDRNGTKVGGDIGLFLLLTGGRWKDATHLTWDCVHLDDEAPWWHILADRAKNHTERKLPLSSQATALLRERLATKPKGSTLVFPSHSDPKRILGQVPSVWEAVSDIAGERLTAHSMRRTWTNCAVKLGVDLWKAEVLTSHVPTGVTLRHYVDLVDLREMGAVPVQRVADYIERCGK